MGCGALVALPRRSSKTSVESGPDCTGSEQDGPPEDAFRTEYDNENLDTVSSLSPSPSVHTIQSSITSIPSLQTGFSSTSHQGRYHLTKGSSFTCDDLRSDVPTIAETIADMQDFQDLPPCTRTSSLSSGRSSRGSDEEHHPSSKDTPRGSKDKDALFGGSHETKISIDTRMHPLAVINDVQIHKSDSCCPAVGDLGTHSEVPSIRDDMSVTSAPSEICVSFPPSIYCSENGTATPTRQRMQQLVGLRSSSGTIRRTSSERSSSSLYKQIKENPLLTLVAQGAQQDTSRDYEPVKERSGADEEPTHASTPTGTPHSTTPTKSRSTPPSWTGGKRQTGPTVF